LSPLDHLGLLGPQRPTKQAPPANEPAPPARNFCAVPKLNWPSPFPRTPEARGKNIARGPDLERPD